MQNIISKIRSYYPVSRKALDALLHDLTRHEFDKNVRIINAGEMNRHVYFIEEGVCRSFILNEGNEITTWFSNKGDITFSLKTLYHNRTGFEYVETLEPCIAYSISIDRLNQLYEEHIDIANWSRIVHQECLLSLQLVRIDRLKLTAKERYKCFLKERPDICNRVNINHIASYLGMNISTLSRIRSSNHR